MSRKQEARKPTQKRAIRSSRRAKRKEMAPRTAAEFLAKSEAFQDKLTRVAHAISKMRAEKVSLAEASREYKLGPQAVLRWGKSGLRKAANGRYLAKPGDRLPRFMVVITQDGRQEIAVNDSRQASLIAKHWNAVDRHLSRGDSSQLRKFRGKSITDATGKKRMLLADIAELDRLGNAGVLSFESIYARTA